MSERIGILGGTFDPIHNGHLAIAEEARWELNLSKVHIVPNTRQPLKDQGPFAAPWQRYEMVKLSCFPNPNLVGSEIEIQRPPPSYTIDTIKAFHEQFNNQAEIWFIMGSDALTNLPQWHQAHQILTLANLAIIERPGTPADLTLLNALQSERSQRITTISGPQLDISSSNIRQRIAKGQPIYYQVPDTVIAYIEYHQLYTR